MHGALKGMMNHPTINRHLTATGYDLPQGVIARDIHRAQECHPPGFRPE
jgi:hypothetical protein